MSDHEHLVKVYPIRLESPAVSSGKKYQIAFSRGKTKAKAPRPIVCTDACVVDFSSLGCFSKAVVHFKESKKKGFQTKIISFEFLDCSADPHGARLGDADIDVAASLDSNGECNQAVRHSFRMCGFMATFVVGIVVQKLVGGKPVRAEAEFNGVGDMRTDVTSGLAYDNDLPTLPASVGVAAAAAHAAMAQAAASANQAAKVSTPAALFYLPRESALAVLSRVEECAKTASLNVRTLVEATGGSGSGASDLSSVLTLCREVVEVNLEAVPERTLLNRDSVEREAKRYEVALMEKDAKAGEEYLRRLLAQSRERLAALRRTEELIDTEDLQITTALGQGTPTSMELERDPPLPLLLFFREYANANEEVNVPSTPVATQPPVKVIVPVQQRQMQPDDLYGTDDPSFAQKSQQAARRVENTASVLGAAAAAKASRAAAQAAEVVAPAPAIPGTAGMANLFGGGGASEKDDDSVSARIPNRDGPADLAPNLFGDSPSQAKPSRATPNTATTSTNNMFNEPRHDFGPASQASSDTAPTPNFESGGLGTDMFSSSVKRGNESEKEKERVKRIEGLGKGMFGGGGGGNVSSNEATPQLRPSGFEPSSSSVPPSSSMFGGTVGTIDMFGGADSATSHYAATKPAGTTGGAGMFGGGRGGEGGGVSMFVDPSSSFGGGGGATMFGGGSAPEVSFGGYGGGGGAAANGSFGAPSAHVFGTSNGGGLTANAFAPTPERGGGAPSFELGGGHNPFGAEPSSGGW